MTFTLQYFDRYALVIKLLNFMHICNINSISTQIVPQVKNLMSKKALFYCTKIMLII